MNCENIYSLPPDYLVKSLTDEFFRGTKLIGEIQDSVYRQTTNGSGSIGGHFRHNLDFANSFLKGIKEGRIDYNRRERDLQVEENRLYAIKRFALTICRFRNLPADVLRRELLVRSEIDAGVWHQSSAARELEFLHSHTVHHHALIAEKLASCGLQVSNVFGVAPSTLKFWEQRDAARQAA